ncbi:SRC kinase signaling inhibitor 1-like isoform X2 [Corythoichthys intestinalis]|uniref:SRC kinase signaling inhibitor 1-like isoform X2 n=1 Tax=Corythoichthys intestinalis TaxID=161448 RepID=UPI0025A63ACD|nr:SRC kinase signaling inhibitor 1-like isoform X2 [Corythoichthys intestinalis]
MKATFRLGREKRKNPMISASDAEFQRDYRTLAGGGSRRFVDGASNGGSPASPSPERRRAAIQAKSLEALDSIHKADGAVARNKMDGSPGSLSLGGAARGRQQQANYWSFKSRTPRASGPSPTRSGRAPFLSAEHPDAMSERDVPAGFSRMNRLRQSLPLSRSSASQAKLHAPGMLFLQLGEETRRVHLTHELSSLDTLRALIVHMFPQRLTMATLRSPSTALLIKDESRNVFYELEDPRDVRDRCVIKIYCKEPVYGTYPGPRNSHMANGDLRREMVYAPQDSPPSRRLGTAPASSQHCPASSSPQGSPSRTRLLYGGGGVRPSSYAGPPPHHQGMLLAHHSPPLQQPLFGASSSAILERRDVKPDDEAGGARGVVLLRADERGGGGVYADPYSLGPESRSGLAGAPHSPLPSRSDPYGSLYRRGGAGGTVCSLMEGGGLYRAGGGLYNDAYAASMLAVGLRVPPPSSPQKIPDMRDTYGGTLPSRGSPARGERRRDSVCLAGDGPRARGLTSEQLCLMAAAAAGADGLRADETETRERMEVMEKQIASLTGLLQRVLSRAPDDNSPDKMESASDGSGTEPGPAKKNRKAATPSGPLALMPPPPSSDRPPSVSRGQMRRQLLGLQQSTNALRTQLSQLRDMQLENQDSVLALLRQTEAELSVLTLEATARTQEDPLQRQRLLVEEERLKYLKQQEALVQKLHELEAWVEDLRLKSSTATPAASQRDLQLKSEELKSLADTLASLKSQFPGLQSKMRVVLRVEVEAVKFLKEEPHRLDALLQRCDNIRHSLSTLRNRQASEKELEDVSGQSQTSSPLSLTDSLTDNLMDSLTENPCDDGWMSVGAAEPEETPPLSFRSRAAAEKSLNTLVSADVTLAAERDWEEKRASLTQFSAQDINRLLEETQAELLKALPDLDLAAKTVAKPAVPPKPQIAPCTGEPSPGKVQLAAQKLNSMESGASQRGAADVGVTRCRTEKPSKSPPPPPPRRSFPSALVAHRNTDNKNAKMEDGELPKALAKLRRTPCDAPRPASTPPVMPMSDPQDADDKEILGGSPASVKGPTVAARLKHLEQGGRKSKEDVKAFPGGQQQVFHF